MRDEGRLGPIEWAVAGQPVAGEDVSGDHWVVVDAGGAALVGVIDGLGHGERAAEAAHRAVAVLSERPGQPLDALMQRCHDALTQSRGAAMSLALITYGTDLRAAGAPVGADARSVAAEARGGNGSLGSEARSVNGSLGSEARSLDGPRSALTWLGVGNVRASLVRAVPGGPVSRAAALLHGGVVGYRLPSQLRAQTLTMRPGDLLVMASDGLTDAFADDPPLAQSAGKIAEDILARYNKGTDDALVLAARHRGTPP
ncbi:SpoIIE family protein phosphatase [Pseudonocardia acaciae]|uniref:SpoIIE family protein phosphatase n=1 Tax=Pseudonocardia acaciae TaxID=551276 RepID=UPI00048F8765|nr:SpoIIE family protein phosphatase [Pseudonocardia acaciae]